jgi:hypothetical protein
MARKSNDLKGLNDLYFFAKNICGFADLSPKLHGEICDLITEAFTGPDQIHQGIVIPRDMFKSSIGLAAVLWNCTRKVCLENDYEWRTLIDAATLGLGTKHIGWLSRTLSSNKEYRSRYGDLYKAGRGFANREIYLEKRSGTGVHREPNFMATSVTSEVTGLHFDCYWPDDIVSERNHRTKHLLQKSIEHFHASLNLLEPHGRILYTATAWHDGDCLGVLRRAEKEREQRGEKPFIRFYVRAALEKNGVPDDVEGESIFPERWSTEKLYEKKLGMERAGQKFLWRSQQMNDPCIAEYAIPFDREHMYVPRKDFPPNLRFKICTVDPNFRNEDQTSGDNAAIIVGGFDSYANWWGLDVRLGQWRSEEFIDQLFDVYRTWRPNQFRMEKKFTSHLITAIRHRESLQRPPLILPMVLIERDWRSKDMRYAGLGAIFASGRVKFAAELSPLVKAEMENELERVGSSAKDDFLDALMDQFTGIYPTIDADGTEQVETFPSQVPQVPVPSLAKLAFRPELMGFQRMEDEWEN